LENFLLKKKVFHFFWDSFYIRPRQERYILTPLGVRQYHSVADGSKEIPFRLKGNQLRTKSGEGPVYCTNGLVKLLSLVANKVATLDPSGIGIEMEADKPNWYDALNGLPGLLGSSTCETFELKRLCVFLLDALDRLGVDDRGSVKIFEELVSFMTGLMHLLAVESEGHSFWVKSNDLKEHYRQRIRWGIEGEDEDISFSDIKRFLHLVVEKTDKAIRLSKDDEGLYSAYFIHEVTEYEPKDPSIRPTPLEIGGVGLTPRPACHESRGGQDSAPPRQGGVGLHKSHHESPGSPHESYVRPLKFKAHSLPLFLEGFVHALRLERDPVKAQKLYLKIRQSPLFDSALKMYKVNCDLSACPEEIGRTKIFPRGWLENESIWLHMEYKFLLEALKAGLYQEFYEDLPHVLVPFFNSKRYGRSILENSSFIVSSVHEEPSLHGCGFVARLSGSTAEVLSIWLLMNVGLRPFELNQSKELCLSFRPVLAAWLFTKKETEIDYFNKHRRQWENLGLPANSYAFHWLGSMLVVYHNPKRLDTFGPRKAEIRKIVLTFPNQRETITVSSTIIPHPFARQIRDQKVSRIDIFLE